VTVDADLAERASAEPEASAVVDRRGTGRPRRARRLLPVLGAFLVVLVVFAASPVSSRSDPLWVPTTAESLLEDRDLDLSDLGVRVGDDYGLIEEDGQVVIYFPWTTAALTVPLLVVQKALEPTGLVVPLDEQGLRADQFQRWSASTFAAAAAVVLALVARRLVRLAAGGGTYRPTGAVGATDVVERWWWVPLSAAAIGLGSSLWSTASRGLWQHGPGVLLLGLAWWAALSVSPRTDRPADARWALVSGACAGLACGVRPTNAVFAAGLVAFLGWRRRAALASWAFGAVAVAAAGFVANVVLLGSPLPRYFSGDRARLHGDFAAAVLHDLVGPSRGLFVFTPWLLLGAAALVPRRRAALGDDVTAFAWLAAATTAAATLAVASYGTNWWAGFSYGPRFLSETLVVLAPLALVVVFGPRPPGTAARVLSSAVAPVLVVASILLHAPGALTPITECWSREPVRVDDDPSRIGDWTDAQFLAGWVELRDGGVDGPRSSCEARRAG
jgi:hypothetical protein